MEAAFEELRQLVENTSLPESVYQRIQDSRIELALAHGDLLAAQSLTGAVASKTDAHPFYRFLGLAGARLALAQGDKLSASQALAGCYAQAEREGWGYGALAVRVLQALAADTQETALAFLTDALQRSQPDGFLRIYADCGRELIPLLEEAARRGVHPLYIGQILQAIGNQFNPRPPANPNNPGLAWWSRSASVSWKCCV